MVATLDAKKNDNLEPVTEMENPSGLELKRSDVSLEVRPSDDVATKEKLARMARKNKNYQLEFEDIKMAVSVPKWMPAFATPGVPGQTKQILKGINGSVSSGQVLAIIGASGSGKTTLLDRLANAPMMAGGVLSGSIRVNGIKLTDRFFKANCAYVHQDDRLWGALTVYENLDMAAKLYSPNLSEVERKQRINNILDATGLQSCKHTKVGNVLIKGVSGGQRRRVSIAVELMGTPALLFLDEPTSGLDSKSAAEIMELLRKIAKSLNVLVVCSIHQPSTRTFLQFDLTLLLSKGKAVYFGPAASALDYFAKEGYKTSQMMNPADFLIEISNPDFNDPDKVDALIAKWDAYWKQDAKEGDAKRPDSISDMTTYKEDQQVNWEREYPYASGYVWQTYVLMQRMFKSYTRDPGAYIGRGVLYTSMSIIFGIIYLGARDKDQESVLDILFAIAWGMATPSYMAVMIMPVFTYESATFEKEAKNGMYAPVSYVISSSLVQMLFVLLTSALSVIPYYWLTDINPRPGRFFLFLLVQYVFLYTVESLCIVAAAVIPNFVIALGVVVSGLSNFFVFNGLFVTPDRVPWVFRWIEFISPHNYALAGLSKVSFSGEDFSGFDSCTTGCFGATGDDVLDAVQGLESDVDLGLIFGVLIAESIALRFLHWYILRNN